VKIFPIYTYGSDVLRKKAKRITKIDDKLIEIAGSMFLTMHKAHGIGLAAPQVGLDMAITVIDISRSEENKKIKTEPITLLNPVIKDHHGEAVMEEGCLSIPYVRADVTRPSTVYIEYQDLDLKTQHVEMKGFISRVAQHEIDHLNGILFIDHLNKDEKKKLKPDLDLIRKGDIEADYLLAEIHRKTKPKLSAQIR
jgi:peptide deformylase